MASRPGSGRDDERARRRRALTQVGVVIVLVVVVLGVTVGVLAVNDGDDDTPTGSVVTPTAINTDGGFYAGDPNGTVTVTMVEDFQCPACRQFEALNSELLQQYAADGSGVRLEYRPIAFLDNQSTTKYSTRALDAALCLTDQNPAFFLPFHNLLYVNQPEEGSAGLTDKQLVSYGVQVGADEATMSTCVDAGTYDAWIKQHTKQTLETVEGTPSVYVNGTQLDNPTAENVEAAVDAAKK